MRNENETQSFFSKLLKWSLQRANHQIHYISRQYIHCDWSNKLAVCFCSTHLLQACYRAVLSKVNAPLCISHSGAHKLNWKKRRAVSHNTAFKLHKRYLHLNVRIMLNIFAQKKESISTNRESKFATILAY